MVNPIPDGYPRLSPYLIVDGAADAIAFYTSVLGAELRGDVMDAPGGKIGHAELQFGDSLVMLADEFEDMGALAPTTVGGTSVTLMVYVEDVDDVFARALAAGATELRGVRDEFYGDRAGTFKDAWGHQWTVATHVEDVTPDEMAERVKAMG